jgi:signal transduction histidine kinase
MRWTRVRETLTADHSLQPIDRALHELSRVLLSTTTVDEVANQSPQAIANVLAPSIECRIDVFDGSPPTSFSEADSGQARLCIPLRSNERLLGAIIVEAPQDILEDELELDCDLISLVSELLSTAIEARMRTAREHTTLLKEAANLKLDAISMLSHEMRTPLASIKGYATALLLEDTDWDAETRNEFLQTIDEESDRLSRLIEGILESASIDANSLRIDLEPVLLPQIARGVVDRIAIQSDIHQFVVMFPPSFPIVEADAGRIEQVLTNLIDNAVKYSPEGGLIVVRGDVRSHEVVISVVDQGTGIEPEDLNKLFDRFFRASSGRRRVSGTGLGLPISSSIVRAHGGRIWAESTVGRGTTLSFTIPHPRAQR